MYPRPHYIAANFVSHGSALTYRASPPWLPVSDERPRSIPLSLAPLFALPSLPVLVGRPFSRVACCRISVSNSDPGHDPPSVFYCVYRKYPGEKTSVRNVPFAWSSRVLCIKVLYIRRNGRVAIVLCSNRSTRRIRPPAPSPPPSRAVVLHCKNIAMNRARYSRIVRHISTSVRKNVGETRLTNFTTRHLPG